MSKFFTIVIFVATSCSAQGPTAAPGNVPAAVKAVPLPAASNSSPLRTFLSSHIYELNYPVNVYTWTDTGGQGHLAGALSSADPAGFQRLQMLASGFWQHFQGAGAEDSLFGEGLYVALDPVSTRKYGGKSDWLLTRIRVPPGFRVLNLLTEGDLPLPPEVNKELQESGCPEKWPDGKPGHLVDLLVPFSRQSGGKQAMDPRCAARIRHVFEYDLQLDAFDYPFPTLMFAECRSPKSENFARPVRPGDTEYVPKRLGAFVVVNGARIRPEDVRVFNAKTSDNTDERMLIQSLFYRAETDNPELDKPFLSDYVRRIFTDHAGYQVSPGGAQVFCPVLGGACRLELSVCTGGADPRCYVARGPLSGRPYPAVISATAPPRAVFEPFMDWGRSLLWADLDGKPTEPQLGSWLKQNVLGCSDESALGPLKH